MTSPRWSSRHVVLLSLVAGLLVAAGALLIGFLRPEEEVADGAALVTSTAPLRVPAPLSKENANDTVNAAFDAPAPPVAPEPVAESARPTDLHPRFKEDSLSLESRLRRAQEHDELNARLAPERPDPTWTANVERRMQDLLAERHVASRALAGVDCRETICRLRLASESDRQEAVMAIIQAARALHPETWLLPEGDEDSAKYYMDVFLPRDGYRLSSGGGRVDSPLPIGEAPPVEPEP